MHNYLAHIKLKVNTLINQSVIAMKRTNQTGFSVVEALLMLVVIGILGFTGWYVYHAKQASDKDYSAASKSTVPRYTHKTGKQSSVPTSSATSGQKVLDIKEWGVKADYASSDDTLSYTIDDNVATIISSKLAAELDCTDQGGGYIYKLKPTDISPATPPDDPQTAQNNFKTNASSYAHIGGYYYYYTAQYQSACSDKAIQKDPLGSLARQVDSFVDSLVPKLVAD